MNDANPDPKKERICACSGTTVGQIEKLIDEGIDDLDTISRKTGACSGCGACDTDIMALIAEYKSQASHQSS